MKTVRKLLVKVVGIKGYLRIISKIYISLISLGFFRKQYAELFFVQKLVSPGNAVMDIGANLGYYSFFLSKQVGKNGKLLAVEPIPLFVEVWKKNMGKYNTEATTMFNCALGSEAQDSVKMAIPVVNGVVRHGLTQVADETSAVDQAFLNFEVPMKVGDDLVKDQLTDRLDFIKCDVEGYEQYVIPSLDQTIRKYHPVLQIELGGEENKTNVVNYLLNLSYKIFFLKGEKLAPIQKKDIFSVQQDLYFIHDSQVSEKQHLIHNS